MYAHRFLIKGAQLLAFSIGAKFVAFSIDCPQFDHLQFALPLQVKLALLLHLKLVLQVKLSCKIVKARLKLGISLFKLLLEVFALLKVLV